MGYYKNNPERSGGFISATVVRIESTGNKVFHKYRRVKFTQQHVERFQRAMQISKGEQGRPSTVIHINYYVKETGRFLHQWKAENQLK